MVGHLGIVEGSALRTAGLPPSLPVGRVLDQEEPRRRARTADAARTVDLRAGDEVFHRNLLQPVIAGIKPLEIGVPVVVAPTVDRRSRLGIGFDDRDVGAAVLRNQTVRRGYPVWLPGFQGIDVLGTALDGTELPRHGKPLDRHFAHGVHLGAGRADLHAVHRHGEGRIARHGRRSRNVERHRSAAIDERHRGAGHRKALRIAAQGAAHVDRLVAVGIGVGEAEPRFRRLLLDEVAFDIGRAVNDGAVGLRDRDRILPAAAFEVDGRGALGRTVVRGRNGDPLERAAADAFGGRGRKPSGVFGNHGSPAAVAAERDLLGRGQTAGEADRIRLADQIAVIAARRRQRRAPGGQQQKLIYSFHDFHFSGSQSFISSSPDSGPVRDCR